MSGIVLGAGEMFTSPEGNKVSLPRNRCSCQTGYSCHGMIYVTTFRENKPRAFKIVASIVCSCCENFSTLVIGYSVLLLLYSRDVYHLGPKEITR